MDTISVLFFQLVNFIVSSATGTFVASCDCANCRISAAFVGIFFFFSIFTVALFIGFYFSNAFDLKKINFHSVIISLR